MTLVDQITYKTKYFTTVENIIKKIKNKTVVPYQLEVQPGRIKGNKICWMPCHIVMADHQKMMAKT